MRYRSFGSIASGVSSVMLMSNTALAVTFNGYDLNTNQSLPLTAASSPSSQNAFNAFSSSLNSATVTTESFETIAVGTPINGLSTTISGTTATFLYTQKILNNPGVPGTTTASVQKADSAGFTNSGTYPTDGMYGISINSVKYPNQLR